MSKMQQTADRLVVIGRGRLIADTTTAALLHGLGRRWVRVRSAQPDALFVELRSHRLMVACVGPDELEVADSTAVEVGALAHSAGVPLHHIAEVEQSLEQAYLELTGSSLEFSGRQPDEVAAASQAAR